MLTSRHLQPIRNVVPKTTARISTCSQVFLCNKINLTGV